MSSAKELGLPLHVPERMRAAVCKMYMERGMSVHAIAARARLGYLTIRRILHNTPGVVVRPAHRLKGTVHAPRSGTKAGKTDTIIRRAIAIAYKKNMTMREIAARMGLSYTTVNKVLHETPGLTIRPRGVPKR